MTAVEHRTAQTVGFGKTGSGVEDVGIAAADFGHIEVAWEVVGGTVVVLEVVGNHAEEDKEMVLVFDLSCALSVALG